MTTMHVTRLEADYIPATRVPSYGTLLVYDDTGHIKDERPTATLN